MGWDEWQVLFGKSYDGLAGSDKARKAFEANVKLITDHNEAAGVG